jgi:ACT domain-containing protein
LTLNADGTFEYAGGEDQYGLDTAVVSFELSGKVYQTQIQVTIEAVNDIPTSKNLDLGPVEFGASKTLSASDIATDKDGDTLKIVIASTTSGAKVTLNADGTLTFT